MITLHVAEGMGEGATAEGVGLGAKRGRVAIAGWLTNAHRVHPHIHIATVPEAAKSAKLHDNPHYSTRRKR